MAENLLGAQRAGPYLDGMERRQLRFDRYEDVLQEAERLAAAGYDRVGNWGLGQACEHLATVMGMSLDGFPGRMPWPVRLAARWLVMKRLLRHEVFRRRVPAPSFLRPKDSLDDRAALERLRAAVTRLQAHQGEMKPSPIFGRLTPEEWREIHLWHCEHHFSFLLPKAAAAG